MSDKVGKMSNIQVGDKVKIKPGLMMAGWKGLVIAQGEKYGVWSLAVEFQHRDGSPEVVCYREKAVEVIEKRATDIGWWARFQRRNS